MSFNGRGNNKLLHIRIIEYYRAIKESKLPIRTIHFNNLKGIMVSKINQTKGHILYGFIYIKYTENLYDFLEALEKSQNSFSYQIYSMNFFV